MQVWFQNIERAARLLKSVKFRGFHRAGCLRLESNRGKSRSWVDTARTLGVEAQHGGERKKERERDRQTDTERESEREREKERDTERERE